MSDISSSIVKVVYSTISSTVATTIQPFINFRLGKESIATFSTDLSSTNESGEWNTLINVCACQNDEDSILSIDLHDTKADGNLLGMGWLSLSDLNQKSNRFSVDIFSLHTEKRELLGLVEISLIYTSVQPIVQPMDGVHLVLPVAPSSSTVEDRIMKYLKDFESRQNSLWSSVQGRLENVEKKVAYFLLEKREEVERVKVEISSLRRDLNVFVDKYYAKSDDKEMEKWLGKKALLRNTAAKALERRDLVGSVNGFIAEHKHIETQATPQVVTLSAKTRDSENVLLRYGFAVNETPPATASASVKSPSRPVSVNSSRRSPRSRDLSTSTRVKVETTVDHPNYVQSFVLHGAKFDKPSYEMAQFEFDDILHEKEQAIQFPDMPLNIDVAVAGPVALEPMPVSNITSKAIFANSGGTYNRSGVVPTRPKSSYGILRSNA